MISAIQRRLERVRRGDAGVTLVELLTVMILLSVVSALTLAAVVSAHQSVRNADDEAIGLADVRTVIERMGRDIREARSVVCNPDTSVAAGGDPSCTAHLQLWIDDNSNYRIDPGETVEWRLTTAADGKHFDVIRQVVGGASQIEATTLVVLFAFTYDQAPPGTQTVTTRMTYDANINLGATQRVVTFSDRLRNVA